MSAKRKSLSANDTREKPIGFNGKKVAKLKAKPCLSVNSVYRGEEVQQMLMDCFAKQKEGKHESEADFITHPFTCCVLPNFVKEDDFLIALKEEIMEQKFNKKNNDLYKFQQTNDIKKAKSPYLSTLRDFLYTDVLQWLKQLTGIPLENTIDASSSIYEYTDVLLCHDDELENRRIAYILYLVPSWDESDGGTLDLFNTDDEGNPGCVVKSILPCWNTFTFFEVSAKSFHQVAEVLNPDKTRLSVSGWFYGPPVKRPSPPLELPLSMKPPTTGIQEGELEKWINSQYFDLNMQLQIRMSFEKDSEVQLMDFLQDDMYLQLANSLKQNNLTWTMLGSPNKRHYEVADETTFPDIVKDALKLFQSESFFLMLSSLTGLCLHPLATGSDSESEDESQELSAQAGGSSEAQNTSRNKGETAGCHMEISRWKHKSYTLVYDNEMDIADYTLDCSLFLNCEGWQNDSGGFISYIVKEEDEELLTVCPQENALALVYRDSKTARFVKYVNDEINKMNSEGEFHVINCTYSE